MSLKSIPVFGDFLDRMVSWLMEVPVVSLILGVLLGDQRQRAPYRRKLSHEFGVIDHWTEQAKRAPRTPTQNIQRTYKGSTHTFGTWDNSDLHMVHPLRSQCQNRLPLCVVISFNNESLPTEHEFAQFQDRLAHLIAFLIHTGVRNVVLYNEDNFFGLYKLVMEPLVALINMHLDQCSTCKGEDLSAPGSLYRAKPWMQQDKTSGKNRKAPKVMEPPVVDIHTVNFAEYTEKELEGLTWSDVRELLAEQQKMEARTTSISSRSDSQPTTSPSSSKASSTRDSNDYNTSTTPPRSKGKVVQSRLGSSLINGRHHDRRSRSIYGGSMASNVDDFNSNTNRNLLDVGNRSDGSDQESEAIDVTICNMNRADGQEFMVSLATWFHRQLEVHRRLCQRQQTGNKLNGPFTSQQSDSNLTAEEVDAVMRLISPVPDPELALSFGLSLSPRGLNPWIMRLTEFLHCGMTVQSLGNGNQITRLMERYASIEKRLGH
eukprot:Clim_evm14s144 gene=Clim_evmTU14s144